MWVKGSIYSLRIKNEYEKFVSLLCFVNEFPKQYPQYTSE